MKKAREWHLELRQTLVVEVIDKETKDTVRNYAEILDSLIKQVEQAKELERDYKFGAEQMEILVKNHNKLDSDNKRLREAVKNIRERVVKECPHTDISFEVYDRCNTALELT